MVGHRFDGRKAILPYSHTLTRREGACRRGQRRWRSAHIKRNLRSAKRDMVRNRTHVRRLASTTRRNTSDRWQGPCIRRAGSFFLRDLHTPYGQVVCHWINADCTQPAYRNHTPQRQDPRSGWICRRRTSVLRGVRPRQRHMVYHWIDLDCTPFPRHPTSSQRQCPRCGRIHHEWATLILRTLRPHERDVDIHRFDGLGARRAQRDASTQRQGPSGGWFWLRNMRDLPPKERPIHPYRAISERTATSFLNSPPGRQGTRGGRPL